MSVEVDRDACVGAGQCVLAAPDVFDQGDEDGLSFVLPGASEPENLRAVRDAVLRCPARAITLTTAPAPEPSIPDAPPNGAAT
ncbi:ferredoxin [Embleya sp. NPDC055664]|uniref:ferredoxin n=1 Tax=unclassified Embleya TaxID=2699296 RepID=UPI0036C88A53